MIWDCCSSVYVVFSFNIINLPFSVFITKGNSCEFLTIEVLVLSNPRHNFVLERLSNTNCSHINYTAYFFLKRKIHKSLPEWLLILHNNTNIFCTLGSQIYHLSISSSNTGSLTRRELYFIG